jgi:hypothetical protein
MNLSSLQKMLQKGRRMNMSTNEITKQIAEASPRLMSRFVAAYYLLTIMAGSFVLFFHSKSAFAIDLVAVVFYVALTAALHALSKAGDAKQGR